MLKTHFNFLRKFYRLIDSISLILKNQNISEMVISKRYLLSSDINQSFSNAMYSTQPARKRLLSMKTFSTAFKTH